MKMICKNCGKEFDETRKTCPECGRKLKPQYTPEEFKEIQKQNDDMTVVNTMLMQ